MGGHDDIEKLIPWYVNGTLTEEEMDTVNGHLDTCGACRRSVAAEVAFARRLRAAPAAIGRVPSVGEAWAELARGLHDRALRARPGASQRALLAALALAVAGGSFLAGQHLQPAAYRTLTTAVHHDGPVLQIIFEPSTSESAIRRVVRQSGGTVIAGPTEKGVYRIGLPAGSDGNAEQARLERSPDVRWTALEVP